MPLLTSFTPPTTSLYQFMALAGLVVFMFFKYLRYSSIREAELQLRLAQREGGLIKVKLARVRENIADMQVKLSDCERRRKKALEQNWDGKEAELEALIVSLNEEYDAIDPSKFDKESHELALEASAYEATATELSDIVEDAKLKHTFDGNLSAAFLTLSLLSFILWYLKIQQYQDIILLHQALGK